MIRKLKGIFQKNRLWIIVIFTLNFIFGVLLWLSNDKAFIYIFPTMIIGSLILYCATAFSIYKNDLKREQAIRRFLDEPTKDVENEIISLFNYEEVEVIKDIGEILRQNQNTINTHKRGIDEYEEYIEAWAHEIKTPLGLMTFVLDNRKEEISPIVYKRLQYVRTKMQEDIERMLYYARLKSTCNDYFFKELSLQESCIEVIEEYKVILQEKSIDVILDIGDYKVLSDKRGIQFIIRQIISNSVKYKNIEISDPHIVITSYENEKNIILTIRDNGIGVKEYDIPFIFEKAFTGEIGEQRKNSTGMGLYLAKQMAKNLKITLEVNNNYTHGFEISLLFPKVIH
ncbi:sensor histidine kinase [Clostridium septicum]|uniref:histidine kinase n=1 Tax=Clostridium septicum TaxID=1504 RepID=A0A9N7JJU0_CLOSE|nr:sensor histidine kinase [Clostridium septicum]AYE33828.1 ATP-binding protein [Clostridium septicum]QAS61974.1 HAMP domain-containing histidine kinase [Clostridium septicum]UEC21560.1 sensor histidine kinase [Clostridium septicum]USS00394.1 sensor histidine kinase [Clostridium septicum]